MMTPSKRRDGARLSLNELLAVGAALLLASCSTLPRPKSAFITVASQPANVGDQPSDLLGGHAEKQFLLPDPFYRLP